MRVSLILLFGAALLAASCERRNATSSGDGEYRGRVVLEVRAPVENSEIYIANQVELAKGRTVLEAAAEKLGLAKRWGEKDAAAAAAKLAPMVKTARVGESSLIELIVDRPKPAEAAEIADALAEAFVQWAGDEARAETEAVLEKLEQKIEDQQEKLQESRKRMLDLMEEHKIVDLDPPPAANNIARAELPQGLRTAILALERLKGDELIEAALDLGLQGPTLNTRYPEYRNLVLARTALLNSGLGSKHPKVVSIGRQIDQVQRMLIDAVVIAKDGLETQLEIAEKASAASERTAKEVAKEQRTEKEASLDYIDLKSEYEREKQRLQEVKEAAAKKSVDAAEPAAGVIVRERAAE